MNKFFKKKSQIFRSFTLMSRADIVPAYVIAVDGSFVLSESGSFVVVFGWLMERIFNSAMHKVASLFAISNKTIKESSKIKKNEERDV